MNKIETLHKQLYTQNKIHFENTLKSDSKHIELMVYDNTYWDELVTFVKNPKKDWAYNNLYPTLMSAQLDYEWVLDGNLNTLITIKRDKGIVLDTLPINKNIILEYYKNKKYFNKFFIDTKEGLLELFTGPIQSSQDSERKTLPHGLLIAGRFWDYEYINSLTEQTGSEIFITNHSESIDLSQFDNTFYTVARIPLKDINGITLRNLYGITSISIVDNLINGYNFQLFLTILFSIITLLTTAYFLYYNVSKPLNTLSNAIEKESTEKLVNFSTKTSEFNKLSSLISSFFEQKAVLVNEIEKRKAISDALKESENRYRNLINNLKEVVFQTNNDGIWTFLNPAWTEITSFSIEESVGINYLDFVHPDDRGKNNQLFKPLIKREKDFCRHIIRYLVKGGGYKWIEVHARLIVNEKNHVLGITGTLIDVHDKYIAEEALKIKDKALFYSNNGVLIVDAKAPNKPVIYANPAFTKITEYSPDEILGKNPRFLHSDDNEQVELDIIRSAIANNDKCEVVLRNYTKSGKIYYNELKISPVYGNDNKVSHFIGIQSDVTNRIFSEREIKKSLEKEKELNELKSRFISMISHEFRTPLTTIFSSTELIERYGKSWDESKTQTHLSRIKKSSENLTEMLNYILNVNRAESGKIESVLSEINLTEFCESIIEDYQLNSGENYNIIFMNNIINKSIFKLDEKLLGQIISNLLSNAIKYSPNGGDVIFELSEAEPYIVIQIKDFGIGIPAEEQDGIFEMFTRAKNVGNINGTGLGLAIIKKTLEVMNGNIFLDSKLGEGTTFTIQIPVI